MKLGVSHQTPGDLNQERFDFLLSLGVEAIEVRLLSHEATREKLEEIKSTDAFRRAMQLADQSPNSGILFCVGTWAEMAGADGKGEDVAGALREFGLGGQVHQVHMRNITAPLPNFSETFPDGGYLDLHSIMDVLIDIDFQGMIVPDHVPGDDHNFLINEAYTLGYLRALIQYAEHKSGT